MNTNTQGPTNTLSLVSASLLSTTQYTQSTVRRSQGAPRSGDTGTSNQPCRPGGPPPPPLGLPAVSWTMDLGLDHAPCPGPWTVDRVLDHGLCPGTCTRCWAVSWTMDHGLCLGSWVMFWTMGRVLEHVLGYGNNNNLLLYNNGNS